MKNQTEKKIGVGSVVKSKVGELEKRMRKEVVVCVHSVVGKKKLLVQLEYVQKK